MKTNYPGHEGSYRYQKEQGGVGWNASEDVYTERHEYFQQLIDDGSWPAAGRVLELGCGAGNTSTWFAQKGYELVGVDLSPTAIEWARERIVAEGVDATFIQGNVLRLDDLDDDQFDLVIDSHCLHCIIGDDRQCFLSEAFRVLKPGRVMWVETMCEPVIAEKFPGYDLNTKCQMVGEGEERFAARYIGARGDLENEVTQAGFQIDSSILDDQSGTPDDCCGLLFIRASKPTQ